MDGAESCQWQASGRKEYIMWSGTEVQNLKLKENIDALIERKHWMSYSSQRDGLTWFFAQLTQDLAEQERVAIARRTTGK